MPAATLQAIDPFLRPATRNIVLLAGFFDEQSDCGFLLELGGYLVDPVHRPSALHELDWRTDDPSAR